MFFQSWRLKILLYITFEKYINLYVTSLPFSKGYFELLWACFYFKVKNWCSDCFISDSE